MTSKEIAIESAKISAYAAIYFGCGAYDYWRHGKQGVIAGLSSIALAGVVGWGVCTLIEKRKKR